MVEKVDIQNLRLQKEAYRRRRENATDAPTRRRAAEYAGKKKSKPRDSVFTEEFTNIIYSLLSTCPNSVKVVDFLVQNENKQDRNPRIPVNHRPLYPGWLTFYQEFASSEQRGVITTLLNQLFDSGFQTLGDVRDADIPALRVAIHPRTNKPRISENGAEFLKKVFPTPSRK